MTINNSHLFTHIAPSDALQSVRAKSEMRDEIERLTREYEARKGAVKKAEPMRLQLYLSTPRRPDPNLRQRKIIPTRTRQVRKGSQLDSGLLSVSEAMRMLRLNHECGLHRERFLEKHGHMVVREVKVKGKTYRYLSLGYVEQLKREAGIE